MNFKSSSLTDIWGKYLYRRVNVGDRKSISKSKTGSGNLYNTVQNTKCQQTSKEWAINMQKVI